MKTLSPAREFFVYVHQVSRAGDDVREGSALGFDLFEVGDEARNEERALAILGQEPSRLLLESAAENVVAVLFPIFFSNNENFRKTS